MNAKNFSAATKIMEERARLKISDDVSEQQIRQWTETLFEDQCDPLDVRRLELVGQKALPILLQLLNDPRLETALVRYPHSEVVSESAMARIVDLLEPLHPPEAVPALLPFVNHKEEHFRTRAAFALGNIAADDTIEVIKKLLADDPKGRHSTWLMMGLDRALKGDRASLKFRNEVFLSVAAILNREHHAAELLLSIDKDKAVALLLTEKLFNTKSKNLHEIVHALTNAGVNIPREQITPLLEAIEPKSREYPGNYEYGVLLVACAQYDDATTMARINRGSDHTNDVVKGYAADAYCKLNGVDDASRVAFERLDECGDKGFENDCLSPELKHYLAVEYYDGEVNNGGHSQFFFNSSGDVWKWTLTGLQAIGAKKHAANFSEALALFGKAGPSIDRDTRISQLESVNDSDEDEFTALDDLHYELPKTGNLRVLLARYAVANKEQFVSKKDVPSPEE